MQRAEALPAYHNMLDFPAPAGLVSATVDPESGYLATPNCPTTKTEVFIAGTEPTEFCPIHSGTKLSDIPPVAWLSHLFGKPSTPQAPAAGQPATAPNPNAVPPGTQPPQTPPGASPEPEKKKGLFDKIFGIFGDNTKKPPPKPKPPQG
jgi:hypothetical protein